MEGLIAMINEAKEKTSNTEDQMMENKEAEKKSDKQLLIHEGRIWEISDTIRQNSIRTIGIAEDEREGQKVYWSKL